MSLFRAFLKNSIIYAVQPLLSKLLLFALVPLYTRYLPAGEYGNVEYVLTLSAFYAAIVDMGLSNAFWNFRQSGLNQGEGKVLFNMLLAVTAIGALLLAVYIVASQFLVLDTTLGFWLSILLVSDIFKKLHEISLMLFTAQAKPYWFLWGGLLYALLVSLLNVWFIHYQQLGGYGVIYAYGLSAFISGMVFVPYLYKKSLFAFDWGLIKQMIRFGLPIMSGNLVLVLLLLSSRLFLKKYANDEVLGQFVFANKWGTLAQVLLLNAFYTAWNPLRWEIFEKTNAKQIFVRFYDVFMLLLPTLGFGLTAAVFFLVPYITFNDTYLQGMYLLPLIVQSFVFFAFYYFDSMAFLFAQKTKYVGYIMLITAATNVLLNLTLVPQWQMEGAAWAFLGSYLIMMLCARYFSWRYYRIERARMHDILLFLSMLLLTIGIGYFAKIGSPQAGTLAGLAACVIWVGLHFMLGKLRLNEVKMLFKSRGVTAAE